MNYLMAAILSAISFDPVVKPVLEIINAMLWPIIAVVAAVGTVYSVFLGVKIAKSDEQNSREKAKKDLINFLIGIGVIAALLVGLKIVVPILQSWVSSQI